MNFENFAFWLKGFFELQDTNILSEKQVKIIKQHLALVLQEKAKELDFDKVIEEIKEYEGWKSGNPGISPRFCSSNDIDPEFLKPICTVSCCSEILKAE